MLVLLWTTGLEYLCDEKTGGAVTPLGAR